jgi:hypothetical protein
MVVWLVEWCFELLYSMSVLLWSECPVWGRSDAGSWWDWLVVVFVEGSQWKVRSGGFDVVLGVDVFPARCRCGDGCLRLFHGRVGWVNHA